MSKKKSGSSANRPDSKSKSKEWMAFAKPSVATFMRHLATKLGPFDYETAKFLEDQAWKLLKTGMILDDMLAAENERSVRSKGGAKSGAVRGEKAAMRYAKIATFFRKMPGNTPRKERLRETAAAMKCHESTVERALSKTPHSRRAATTN
jgi:hypothetical protein